jgi:hypothetical protein
MSSGRRSQHSLAEFELLLLLAALRLGPDEAYTVSIAEHIQERTGRTVRRANVFTTLQRLEAARRRPRASDRDRDWRGLVRSLGRSCEAGAALP